MDEIEMLRQHAVRTSAAEPPIVDVSGRVLASIRSRRPQRDPLGTAASPMWLAAAASLLVAGTLGIYAQHVVAEWDDPLCSLFTPLVVTLQ